VKPLTPLSFLKVYPLGFGPMPSVCYSPFKKIIKGSKRLPAADDAQQNNHNGNDEQDVDKPADRIR